MHYTFLLLIHLLISQSFDKSLGQSETTGDIIVHVKEIKDIKGDLLVGIYQNQQTFRKIKKVYKYTVKKVGGNEEVVVLKNIPTGTYAIAIFQDFNGNKKFDYNFFGIPKEPFGFSTNFKVTRRAPKYREVTFEHESGDTELTINIQKW